MRRFDLGVLMDEAPAAGGGNGGAPPPPDEAAKLRAELERKNKENDELKRKMASAPTPQPTFQRDSRLQQPAVDPKELTRQFFEKPLDMTSTIAQLTVNNAIETNNAMTFETMKAVAKREARGDGESAKLFDQYEGEIEAMVSTAPPQMQQNIHVWKNAFKNVVGEHQLRGDLPRSQPSRGEGNVAPAVISRSADGPAPPSSAPPPAGATEVSKLTSEEREVAIRFGEHAGWGREESLERYAHGKFVRDNQGTGKARSESAWDKVITFNNLHRRREAAKGGK